MDFRGAWEKALRDTNIIRPRVKSLETFEFTRLPYVFLSASAINAGDTVRRAGEIKLDKPAVILPGFSPQFEGFEFDDRAHFDPSMFTNMLLVRGVTFPSLKYRNRRDALELLEENLPRAVQTSLARLERSEDVTTTLLTGPEDCWQMSLLIFIAGQVARSAQGDVRKIFEKYRRTKWF